MNSGRRMDENKQFSQLFYAALEYCLIVHNSFKESVVRRYLLSAQYWFEKWLSESREPFGYTSNLGSLGGATLCSYLHSCYTHFIRLPTLDPIRGSEHAALFPRRPKEILDDWMKAPFCNLMIVNFKSNVMSLRVSKKKKKKKQHITYAHLSAGFSVSRLPDTFRPQFITVARL